MSKDSSRMPALPTPDPNAPWPTFSISLSTRHDIGNGKLLLLKLGTMESNPASNIGSFATIDLGTPVSSGALSGSSARVSPTGTELKRKRVYPPIPSPALPVRIPTGRGKIRTHVPGGTSTTPLPPSVAPTPISTPRTYSPGSIRSSVQSARAGLNGTIAFITSILSIVLLGLALYVFATNSTVVLADRVIVFTAALLSVIIGSMVLYKTRAGDKGRRRAGWGITLAIIAAIFQIVILIFHIRP